MQLYCEVHRDNHELTDGDAERLIYALQVAYADALTHDYTEFGDDIEYELHHTCPQRQLDQLAHDPEVHLEHVNEMVISRRTTQRRDAIIRALQAGGR